MTNPGEGNKKNNEPVKVITAGGAANTKRKKKRRHKKKGATGGQGGSDDDGRELDHIASSIPGDDGVERIATTHSSSTSAHGGIRSLGGDGISGLEIEQSESADVENDDMAFARPQTTDNVYRDEPDNGRRNNNNNNNYNKGELASPLLVMDDEDEEEKKKGDPTEIMKSDLYPTVLTEVEYEDIHQSTAKANDVFWLVFCFSGIMASFVCYGLLLEYTTSGGRKLHELSFLFVTSLLYTITAAAGRYVRAETPTTIPPARFAVLGLTSMGSTFCSVRSLRYVIYPIQVLAKSCKPVPVMLMGALMGKRYPARKYFNVAMIVAGVALFMGGGDKGGKGSKVEVEEEVAAAASSDVDAGETGASTAPSQLIGIGLLFVSLCFDGGTGAYEDKLMSVHSVQPFDLMYNIQLGKTILAGVSLLVLNQLHIFVQMCQDMGLLLVALGLSGALGQVFIFVTIAKFGALTCSIIGLARKVTTLVASIYFYGHHLNGIQFSGLLVAVGSMVMNFWGKKDGGGKKGGGGHDGGGGHGSNPETNVLPELSEEMQRMLNEPEGQWSDDKPASTKDGIGSGEMEGDIELATKT